MVWTVAVEFAGVSGRDDRVVRRDLSRSAGRASLRSLSSYNPADRGNMQVCAIGTLGCIRRVHTRNVSIIRMSCQ